MNKKIGIIVPTFNRPILLKRALQSIFEQSYNNWNLYIVNDGGYENDIKTIVNYFKKKYNSKNDITIHNNSINLGKAISCNIALSKTDTEMVVILNDDDTWSSEFLQASIYQLEYRNKLNPLVKGITCLSNTYHEEVLDDGAYTQWCDTPTELELNKFYNYISFSSLINQNSFSSSQFIFYKNVIEKIGKFNETMLVYSDWEFNIRFISHFEIYRQIQPFANIYKRFWTTIPSYQNLLTVHHEKLNFYSNKINDILLRQTVNSDVISKNNTHQLTMQTVLLLRMLSNSQAELSDKSIQLINSQISVKPISEHENIQQLNNRISDQIINLENKMESQTKLYTDWFKYLEYKLKNPIIRKLSKAFIILKNKF